MDPQSLVITAEPWGHRRFLVRRGTKEAGLTAASRTLLLQLHEAQRRDSGWLPLPKDITNRQRVSRLRQELQQLDPEARWWIDNDYEGRYRLSAAAPLTAVRP